MMTVLMAFIMHMQGLLPFVEWLNFAKWTAFVGGTFITGYKGISWGREKLTTIHSGINDVKTEVTTGLTGIRTDVKEQTNALIIELRELRQDIRALNQRL